MPVDEWLEATVYTVTIDSTVSSTMGEHLAEAEIFQFHTTGILNVLTVFPEPDNSRVLVDEVQLSIAFDRPVVPRTRI